MLQNLNLTVIKCETLASGTGIWKRTILTVEGVKLCSSCHVTPRKLGYLKDVISMVVDRYRKGASRMGLALRYFYERS